MSAFHRDDATFAAVGYTDLSGTPPTPNFSGAPTSPNFLHNAQLVICQRGTGPWTTGAAVRTVDRWNATRFGTAGATMTRSAATAGTGARYKMRIQRDNGNASTQLIAFYQALDSASSLWLAGQPITFSFAAIKGANFSPTSSVLTSRITYGQGIDEAAGGVPAVSWTAATVSDQSNTITGSRVIYSHTATPPAATTQVGFALTMSPVGTAGAADYVDIDSLCVNLGATAVTVSPRAVVHDFAECAMFYEDMARNPYTGGQDLRVISQGSANTAGGAIGTDQYLWMYIRHKAKRQINHTLTLGDPATGHHLTHAGGFSVYDLEEGTTTSADLWSHTTTEDTLLQMHYEIDGGAHPALANYHQFLFAMDGAAGSKFAIDCDLGI